MTLVTGKTKTFARLRFVINRLFDLVVPPTCLICAEPLAQADGLCGGCWRQLVFITGPMCHITGQPMALDLGPEVVSLPAQLRPPPYDMARAAFAYRGAAARLIRQMKFADRPEIARMLAPHMVRAAGSMFDHDSILLPVPLHRRRLLMRRFNQSAELCRALSQLTGCPVLVDALVRVRATRQQIGLTRAGRKRNLRDAFALRSTGHSTGLKIYRDRALILVDDVLTTGATVEACARILRAAGASRVYVLTAARVVMPERLPIF